jgi:TolB-like protein/Tfp pilus assembly protein PilF
MAKDSLSGKLAVILHTDVAGSTRLVQQDEQLAHERIQDAFRRFSDTIGKYHGRVQELRGDALLAEFERASDAVTAALAFQSDHHDHLGNISDDIQPELRIGIALGEVVIADGTVTGAGVVLAQRVEQLAEPGGLCITSAVHEALPNRMPFSIESLGEQALKGFEDHVRVYRVRLSTGESVPLPQLKSHRQVTPGNWWQRTAIVVAVVLVAAGVGYWSKYSLPQEESASIENMAFPLPDKPSIAVLPFTNKSSDADQEYFAEGVTEDIITDLSKVSGLFVVARDSTFAYRMPEVKLTQVAEALGVRYILEGSVRRSGQNIRITAQLVDVLDGTHLWSERYDRKLEDVFAVQSEVAAHVAKALAVTLKSEEHERLFQKYTTNIEAYDTFILARRVVDSPSRENVERGGQLFERVIQLDPNFAGGYAGLSFNYSVKARFGYGSSRKSDSMKSLELAHKAIEIDSQFGWSYVALGGAQLAAGDASSAVETMRQALVLQPGDHEVHLFMGLYLQFAGQSATAIEHLELASRMNPVGSVRNLAFLGMAYFMNKRYADSIEIWTRRLDKYPIGNEISFVFLAASHALNGDVTEAEGMVAKLKHNFPDFKLDTWKWSRTYQIRSDREHLHEGAELAGIP